ncbi:MAG: hypothetical protein ACJ8D9_16015 [Xanthobacteraceae bacterium]
MTGVHTKRFNWLPTRSAWKEAQLWRARRAAASQRFQDDAQYIAQGLATAQTNLISGTGTIVIQRAMARIQEAAKAKITSSLAKVDTKA